MLIHLTEKQIHISIWHSIFLISPKEKGLLDIAFNYDFEYFSPEQALEKNWKIGFFEKWRGGTKNGIIPSFQSLFRDVSF